DYSFVCGGFISRDTINQKDDIIIKQKTKGLLDDSNGFEITFSRIKKDWITKTLTLLYKVEYLNFDTIGRYIYQRDIHVVYHLLKAGKGYYFKEVFGVYNI